MVDREDFIRWAVVNYSVEYALTHMSELLDKYMEEMTYDDISSSKPETECIS